MNIQDRSNISQQNKNNSQENLPFQTEKNKNRRFNNIQFGNFYLNIQLKL